MPKAEASKAASTESIQGIFAHDMSHIESEIAATPVSLKETILRACLQDCQCDINSLLNLPGDFYEVSL